MDELLTTPQAAEIFGIERVYAARLARRCVEQGREWPVKKGRTYVAPLKAWKEIFHPKDKVLRKRRKEVNIPEQMEIHQKEALLSCSKAAAEWGMSPTWALVLAKRSYRMGNPYPIRSGNMWLPTWEEWKMIFNDPRLRVRPRKK